MGPLKNRIVLHVLSGFLFGLGPEDLNRNIGANTWSANRHDAGLDVEAAWSTEARSRGVEGKSLWAHEKERIAT
ncbi:MAG: hypothetical protein JEZ04_19675 [Spirochaetales bacterium]|nr:hypothetical protein [Spirochaetales bacterium]